MQAAHMEHPDEVDFKKKKKKKSPRVVRQLRFQRVCRKCPCLIWLIVFLSAHTQCYLEDVLKNHQPVSLIPADKFFSSE